MPTPLVPTIPVFNANTAWGLGLNTASTATMQGLFSSAYPTFVTVPLDDKILKAMIKDALMDMFAELLGKS